MIAFPTRWTWIHVEETPSTNDLAYRLVRSGEKGVVVRANRQTRGRGRAGHTWHSPEGGLWMSLAFQPATLPDLQKLTLITPAAVVDALPPLDPPPRIRLPNDLFLQGKKLGGVLGELRGKVGVIGIGLNIKVHTFPEEIRDRAVSLDTFTADPPDLDTLAEAILQHLTQWVDLWKRQGFPAVFRLWKGYLDTVRYVRGLWRSEPFQGKLLGMDESLTLTIEDIRTGARRFPLEELSDLVWQNEPFS